MFVCFCDGACAGAGASLIESFNREIVTKALQQYVSQLDAAVQLPVDIAELEKVGGASYLFAVMS